MDNGLINNGKTNPVQYIQWIDKCFMLKTTDQVLANCYIL